MTNTKNAAAIKTPEKANVTTTTTQKQHSMPFYISANLFHNRRLKHKRSKWAAAVRKAVANRERKKTEVIRHAGPADVTIDLLSDDDDDAVGTNMQQATAHEGLTPNQPNYQQHYIVYPDHLQLSQVPNITLIPVQPYQTATPQPLQKRLKRKRKSRLPKRHAQPTIVNNESIVLTDDSDTEETPQARTIAAVEPPKQTSPAIAAPVTFAQVDEEVTVSIVPRSSTAGSCSSKPLNTELFPMLPDETTVHTVISNRIYELSLTKLREGLASCGIPEYASEGQQKVSPTRRSKCGKTNAPPAAVMPKPTPISLKLSSDLSISLISDDDDEEDAEEQHMNAEKLLQRQPQLSVQQLQVPLNYCMIRAPPRQAPRRRKLG